MTKDDLLRRLKDHEDHFTERKSQGISPFDLRRTVCAFANSTPDDREAVLFIGLHDRTGKVVGVDNDDALQKRVREACEECYPPITPRCEVLAVEDKSIVAVVISASTKKPHFTGGSYIRVGSESVKASERQFESLIAEHHDTCRQIRKHIGETITVFDLKSGFIGQVPWPVTLTDCTPHVVKYRVLSSDVQVSKSLEELMVTYDDNSHCFALRVKT